MELFFYNGKDCKPCAQIKPHVIEICKENGIKLHIIDREDNAVLAMNDKVLGVPTFIMKKGHKELRRKEGASAVPAMKKWILEG